ncbi:MAG: TIR domain-containing protein [Promethearchaeia archaeon]
MNAPNIIVFISYNHKDTETFKIREVVKSLKNFEQINDVLYYEQETYDNFIKFMNDNIGICDVVVLFCSPNSLKSSFVEKEWTAADALGKPIIPIFLKTKHIPPLLSPRVGIEFNSRDFDQNIKNLINIIMKKTASKIKSESKESSQNMKEEQSTIEFQDSGMKMCKKCNTFLAMQGSDYCATCKPSSLNIGQSQVSNGAQQQAQNISAMGITVSQQQSQASGGSQQESFLSDAVKPKSPEIMTKLSSIEKDLKVVKRQQTQILETQLLQYENLTSKLNKLNKRKDELNSTVTQFQSIGDLSKANELQHEIEQLKNEIKEILKNMQESIDIIAENAVKVLENQELTEEFMKEYLASDWDKIRIVWKDYKEGNITKKDFIKKIIKRVGIWGIKKLL